jgi:hypothetical protein
MIENAIKRLKAKLSYQPVGLICKNFFSELENLYCIILEKKLTEEF